MKLSYVGLTHQQNLDDNYMDQLQGYDEEWSSTSLLSTSSGLQMIRNYRSRSIQGVSH
jgi:hypothetical protein